ncbi:MAG TPA: UDP-N-acetylmuramoyl-L-alanyl-D-glutamate--2,6-diaminopimelate ligase, partial [Candidatus Cloacimonetes bacterium]|nr:UDP-N-acetylmuramoyl-L-alanyl-D-glutamate--2,6-diaminopimelate ligase [Candidatus Cloacimonadota bacterium]
NFSLISKCSSERYRTNLTGKYNIKNIASAILVIKHFVPDISPKELNKFLHKIKVIPGRLERVRKNIFIDYAHTPDALENVLKTLTEISDKRIICVFGAGGDRDRQKRPQMLKAVLKYSNLAIITSDNPRFEEPSDIIDDITRDFDPMQPFWIQQDRSLAIQTAIDLAGEKDIVLLAGKGHETFQAIKGKNVHFSDKEEVLVYFNKGKGTDKNELSIPIDILQLEILFGQKNRSKKNRIFNFISLDSRSIKDNSIFFALKGENFDGHDYVREVLQHRNCVAVVNKNFITKGQNLIFVNDTLSALGKFAQKFKSLFNVTAIALTGSIGKTTTKEFIYNILSDSGNTLKTSANENNLIGLPKTIFNLKPNHKYAIFELGSNHFGEIAKLAEICNPDIGIITFVGPAHLEFFKDENGVYQEKSSLFRRNLKKKIFPGDDERFKEFKGITFGFNDSCSYQISKITKKESNTEFFINERKFMIPTPFKHFCLNATIAVALAKEVGIREKKIKANLLKSLQISQRMEIRKLKNHTLLIDCYNANPDSMLAAIDFWKNFEVDKNHI